MSGTTIHQDDICFQPNLLLLPIPNFFPPSSAKTENNCFTTLMASCIYRIVRFRLSTGVIVPAISADARLISSIALFTYYLVLSSAP
ncbi:hypothetical protein Tco_1217807 [Tanacetum coccineum]